MHIGGGESSQRKKSLDAEVNLVPFIDLLSMCICFLLMTAVWIQIASVQVKQSHGTEAALLTDSLDLDVKFSGATSVEFTFKKSGKVVKTAGFVAPNEAALIEKLNTSLPILLKQLGKKVGTAMITPKTGVSYGNMVTVMDALRKNQIANIGVVPVSGGPR